MRIVSQSHTALPVNLPESLTLCYRFCSLADNSKAVGAVLEDLCCSCSARAPSRVVLVALTGFAPCGFRDVQMK